MLYSVLATVLYLACLICGWGFVSLATNTDVIAEPVGPLVGPVMAALASVIVFFGSLFGLRAPSHGLGWPRALVAGVAVYLLVPLVGGLVVTVERVDAVVGLLFFVARATGPYLPTAAILAAVVVLVAPLVRSGRNRA